MSATRKHPHSKSDQGSLKGLCPAGSEGNLQPPRAVTTHLARAHTAAAGPELSSLKLQRIPGAALTAVMSHCRDDILLSLAAFHSVFRSEPSFDKRWVHAHTWDTSLFQQTSCQEDVDSSCAINQGKWPVLHPRVYVSFDASRIS